jgi:hypothetical protein
MTPTQLPLLTFPHEITYDRILKNIFVLGNLIKIDGLYRITNEEKKIIEESLK